MARVIALAHSAHARSPLHLAQADLLRSALVTGCALALILAKAALPF